MDLNIRLLILILRTLGETQPNIAIDLKCSDHLPGDTERWFEALMLNEASSLVNDEVVKRIVFEKLSDLNLDEIQLIRAGSLTAADILRHYEKIPISEKPKSVFDISVYRRHQDGLLELAARLQEQLWVPEPWKIFNADVCWHLHLASKAEKPVMTGFGDGLNAPVLELKSLSGSKIRVSDIRLTAECDDLYPALLSHIFTEYDLDADIISYKRQMVTLLDQALGLALDIITRCQAVTGTPYSSAPDQPGLWYSYPALICRSAVEGDFPQLELRMSPTCADTWELYDKRMPTATLAFGSNVDMKRCRDKMNSMIKARKQSKAWLVLNESFDSTEKAIQPMRKRLGNIVIRGYLEGTCPLCAGYQPSN